MLVKYVYRAGSTVASRRALLVALAAALGSANANPVAEAARDADPAGANPAQQALRGNATGTRVLGCGCFGDGCARRCPAGSVLSGVSNCNWFGCDCTPHCQYPTPTPPPPTPHPTRFPTPRPTTYPTPAPSAPTSAPTYSPTSKPTSSPTSAPTAPTRSPTGAPFDPALTDFAAPEDKPASIPDWAVALIGVAIVAQSFIIAGWMWYKCCKREIQAPAQPQSQIHYSQNIPQVGSAPNLVQVIPSPRPPAYQVPSKIRQNQAPAPAKSIVVSIGQLGAELDELSARQASQSPAPPASARAGECVICLESLPACDGFMVPCGCNSFHYECAAALAACPLCRTPGAVVRQEGRDDKEAG